MRVLLLLFSLLYVGCASGIKSQRTPVFTLRHVDVELFSVVREIEKQVGQVGTSNVYLVDNLQSKDAPALGVCVYDRLNGLDRNTIKIDKQFFEEASPFEVDIVMLHEIGHCEFNIRGHRRTPSKCGYVRQLMHPHGTLGISETIWRELKDCFIEEMKEQVNTTEDSETLGLL